MTAKVVVIVQGDEDDPRHVFTYADIIKEVELNKFVQIFTLPLLVSFKLVVNIKLTCDDDFTDNFKRQQTRHH